jgi:hypothetical protein
MLQHMPYRIACPSPPTASATIKGFEIMRMIRKGHCLMLEPGTTGEVRFVNRLFRIAA